MTDLTPTPADDASEEVPAFLKLLLISAQLKASVEQLTEELGAAMAFLQTITHGPEDEKEDALAGARVFVTIMASRYGIDLEA